jgi:hypothetical protein
MTKRLQQAVLFQVSNLSMSIDESFRDGLCNSHAHVVASLWGAQWWFPHAVAANA